MVTDSTKYKIYLKSIRSDSHLTTVVLCIMDMYGKDEHLRRSVILMFHLPTSPQKLKTCKFHKITCRNRNKVPVHSLHLIQSFLAKNSYSCRWSSMFLFPDFTLKSNPRTKVPVSTPSRVGFPN